VPEYPRRVSEQLTAGNQRICVVCQTESSAEVSSCPRCGAQFPEPGALQIPSRAEWLAGAHLGPKDEGAPDDWFVCPSCGKPAEEGASSCTGCAASFPLSEGRLQLPLYSEWDAERRKKGEYRWSTVKWWGNRIGHGFLEGGEGRSDTYVHWSRIADAEDAFQVDLAEGEPVVFLEVSGPKFPEAVDLIRIRNGPTAQHVLTLEPDGTIRYVPALTGPQQFGRVERGAFGVVWSAVAFRNQSVEPDLCAEFERILNANGLRESHIQEFLEAHPELLLGNEFEMAVPQVSLQSAEGSLRPDFILRPIAGVSYEAKIVELKLPGQPVVKPRPVQRPGFYAAVNDAVAQLRAYGRYFDDEKHRVDLSRQLGFSVYRPRLTLLIGRTQSLPPDERRAQAMASLAPIELLTYDDLILRYRRLGGSAARRLEMS
jgi:cold shock CspA family protein